MDFKINFNLDNDAFTENPEGEVCRIMERIGEKIKAGATFGKILDINGNTVGRWGFFPPLKGVYYNGTF